MDILAGGGGGGGGGGVGGNSVDCFYLPSEKTTLNEENLLSTRSHKNCFPCKKGRKITKCITVM